MRSSQPSNLELIRKKGLGGLQAESSEERNEVEMGGEGGTSFEYRWLNKAW